MQKHKARWSYELLGGLLLSTALNAAAAAQDRTHRFELPAEPLGAALRDYGRIAQRQLIFTPQLAQGRTAPALNGRYDADQALTLLLAGSDLAWRRAPSGGVMIVRKATSSPQSDTVAAPDGAEPLRSLDALVVTGTHIGGAAPVGARPIVLDTADIERLGRANAADLLRTLPQNLSLGTGEEARGAIQASQPNLGFATGPNLRGLGADATLSLLDGRRLPQTTYGGVVDISQIPLIALQRVEVLADGASAIYGSDAVGGVVNFILKRDIDGAEARVRVGAADGLDEQTYSGAAGHTWRTGSVFAALDYEHRSRLAAADRSYFTDDLRAFGGPDLRRANASPGTISAGGVTYAIPAGQNGVGLRPDQLIAGTSNLDNRWEQADILPSISRLSGAANFRQELTPWATLFVEALGQSRESVKRDAPSVATVVVPRSNPFFVSPDPKASTVSVLYSFIGDLGPIAPRARTEDVLLSSGLELQLPRAWRATLEGTFAHDRVNYYYDSNASTGLLAQALADPNPATAFNPFGDAGSNAPSVVDRIRGFNSNRSHLSYGQVAGNGSGPLLELPGGELRLAVGAEARHEHLVSSNATLSSRLTPTFSGTNLARDIDAVYAEANLPLVSDANARPGLQRLTLSAAVRHEHYSDSGDSTNPRFGVEWRPVRDLTLSASWGTSFKAPSLYQKDTSTNVMGVVQAPLAASPTGFVSVIQLAGKAPGLTPETAETWTAGVDWRPERWRGLELGAHYFSVRYRNRILNGTSAEIATALASTAPSPLVVERQPTAAEVLALYADPKFAGGSARPPPSQIFAIVDFRQQNLGTVEQSGVDLSGHLGWDVGANRFAIAANAVYIARYAVARVPGDPLVSLRNTSSNPIDWRGDLTLSWLADGWDAALRVNYVAGYRNTTIAPAQPVSDWTTFDLHVARTFDAPWVSGVTAALDVRNLFDKDPPRVANVQGLFGYDPEEATALGRMVSLTLSKRW